MKKSFSIKLVFIAVLLGVFTLSCEKDPKIDSKISGIRIDFEVERFDQLFSNSNPNNLPSLKQNYPFLFSSRIPDSIWVNKMKDTLQIKLAQEVSSVFNDFNKSKTEIRQLFQHLKYYFKEFKEPRVITVTSNVDYRNKVIVTDTIVLIALDTYLGSNHEFYSGISKYQSQNFNKNQITPDLASEYAKKYSYQPQRRTLIDEMIYFGKLLYFKDMVLPFKLDAEKIGYTTEKLEWAKANEAEIWRYFIERELLFKTDPSLLNRFINPAPFTKFYLELDSESPGRIGQYIGWQIVRSYMNNNDVSLNKMLITESEEIYKKSKFKPRK